MAFGSDSRSNPENAPRASDATRDAILTPARYRAAWRYYGVPFRSNGLFPLHDRLLTELAADPNLRAFQKNVLSYHETNADVSLAFEVAESWAHERRRVPSRAGPAVLLSRNARDETGWFPPKPPTGPSLTAAFRLGDGAAIGRCAFTNAHGGSIETVLDEATAELVKCARAPNCATTELRAKILKPVALHKTYPRGLLDRLGDGFRARTEAKITDPEDGTTYATCERRSRTLSAIERSRR